MMRKLTSHFSALSLKAFWNWTAMSVQKPEVLRVGAEVPVGHLTAGLAPGGAATGATELADVGTGEASVAASVQSEQGLARELVTLRKLTYASRVRIVCVAVWRNWQTQQTQNLPGLCSVWVQVPPPPPKFACLSFFPH